MSLDTQQKHVSSFADRILRYAILSFALLLQMHLSSFGEQVGKLYYEGYSTDLYDSLIGVPSNLVALSEKINFPTDSSSLFIKSSSIFFILDNSGSMDGYYSEGGELIAPKDPLGNRFEVMKAIVDTLSMNPETFPGVECGLAVFQKDLYFDDSLDQLLDTLRNDTIQGGYIPLLKVDSTYESGEDGLMTPKDIFYKYLTTQKSKYSQNFAEFDTTVTWEAVRLTQPRDPKSKGGTNINTGFKAALQAMKESSYEKENQFIVFISDGISSFGTGDDYETGVINNDKIMTTFTVYFAQNDTTPPSLTTMNEAIKSNGYSSSNRKYTQLWEYQNNSKEELVSFFMENIVKVFEGISKTGPKDLVLKNSSIGSHWDAEKKQFILDGLIPFTGDTTEIGFDITVETSYDSLDADGEIITIKKDTGISITNTYWLDDPATPLQPKFTSSYWDRNIVFQYEGSNISTVNETMNTLELLFTNNPMESEYRYTTCTFEILATNSGDREIFTLDSIGKQEFYKKIPLQRNTGTPNKNNGTLEHDDTDTFRVTFRNSEKNRLPLDTLVKEITYQLSTHINIEEAAYFDNSGDGLIDSISVRFDKDDPVLHNNKSEIVSLLQFPAHRKLSILSSQFRDELLELTVKEGNSTPNTAVSNADIITTKEDIILSKGGSFPKQEIAIADSLAPVILWASLRDNATSDTLQVLFSEEIRRVTANVPFRFYARQNGDTPFTAQCKLLSLSQNDKAAHFEITDYSDSMEIQSGDSINIHWEKRVADKSGLFQENSHNIKREITALSTIGLKAATYHDNNADGFIDSLNIEFQHRVPEMELFAKEIAALITLPSQRNFSLLTSSLKDKELSLTVVEGTTTPNTAVSLNEKVTITDETMIGTSMLFPVQEIPIADSLAPVILKASLNAHVITKKDTLNVEFSEAIAPPSSKLPFYFYKKGESEPLSIPCTFNSFEKGNNKASFEIDKYPNSIYLEEGDSIHINWLEDVKDTLKNSQKSTNNIKRALRVDSHEENVSLTKAIYFDTDANGKVDKVNIYTDRKPHDLYADLLIETFSKALGDIELRNLDVESCIIRDTLFQFSVVEKSDETNSAVTESDEIKIPAALSLGKCLTFPACEVAIEDSMAPVILSATVTDSLKVGATDLLEIRFSEKCDTSSLDIERPFRFFRDKMQYTVHNSLLEEISGDRVLFSIDSLFDLSDKTIKEGDSICIHEDKNISDRIGNKQENRSNIRQPIFVNRIMAPVDIELKATTLTPNDETMYIQLEIVNVQDLPEGTKLSGIGQLFDPVGNRITAPFAINYDTESNLCIYEWDGKNHKKRDVGAGAYFLIVEKITLTLPERYYGTDSNPGRKSIMVFVQREK